MRHKIVVMFKHSSLMVKRNVRSYALLSITILISFTILLSFLAIVDSNIYNENKEIFSISPNVIILYDNGYDSDTIKTKYNVLINKMSRMNGIHYYQYYQQQVTLGQYGQINASINYIPNNIWGFYVHAGNYFKKISMIDNKDFSLKQNEAIVDRDLYNLLKKSSKDKNIVINIPVYNGKDISYYIKCKVVGACEVFKESEISVGTGGNLNGIAQIFISQNTLKEEGIKSVNSNMLIYSSEVLSILQTADKLDIACDSPYIYQQAAIEKIRIVLREKYIILLAFVVILGINLYSCMKNVLYDRYFEIGVKRAIGIKKQDIVFQFFIEGIFVMIVNIIISLICSNTILNLYKLFLLKFRNVLWTIFISKYSLIVYIISCILLTIAVSVLLAYQAINFEIVKYLKED